MTVINALINAWSDYGPGLTDSLINNIIAAGCRYFFKQLRQLSRAKAMGRSSSSSADGDTRPPPEERR
ncbi:MAG: hypothetical protein ACK4MY_13475 [Brevundimonas sp.]